MRTTPTPLLESIDRAGETLRGMRHSCELDERFADAGMVAELTAAIAVLMRYRGRVARGGWSAQQIRAETVIGRQEGIMEKFTTAQCVQLKAAYDALSTTGIYSTTDSEGRVLALMDVARGAIFGLLTTASIHNGDEGALSVIDAIIA